MMKDCTQRARFKINAIATACAGLVEIQTLRSVYETQIKKTAMLSGKRFIPLDKFENELRISSSLPSIVGKFRTHQEEKTYVHLMTNTSKWCLLNTDLRSVSNAALRKLWHSYLRFWNAPIVVLIIIMHIVGQKRLSSHFSLRSVILKMQ